MSTETFNLPADKTAFGGYGINEITSSGAVVTISSVDRFATIEAIGDTTFAFTNDADKGMLTAAAQVLKDGKFMFGNFHSLVVASGKLRVYYTKS
jgi:hypothetical protein